jgi:hypothetical protein
MKNTLYLSLIALLFATSGFAQKKGKSITDPWFEEFTREPFQQGRDGSILIEIKNTGSDVNDCITKAKQQAVFAVIFTGYTESNNIPAAPALSPTDMALYHEKTDFFKEFFGNTSQYGVYVPKAVVNPKRPVSKINKKTYEAHVIVTVEVDRLRKQLEAQEIIKATADFGFEPSVVIVPSDDWMENHNYFRIVDNDGITNKIYDYANAILDKNIKHALSAVAEKLGGPNGSFDVKDIKANLDALKLEEAKNSARNSAKQESDLDIFARVLDAQLWVKVGFDSKPINGGLKTQFLITLSATDPFTGRNVIPGKTIDKTTVGDDYFNLMKNAMNGAIADFQPKLFSYFEKLTEEGIQGSLRIEFLDEVDANFSEEFEYDDEDYELAELVDAFVKKHSMERKTEGAQTKTRRVYSVKIPLMYMNKLTDEKEKNDFEKFSRKVRKSLKELGLKSEGEVDGLGKVNIVITEGNY